MRNTFVNWKLPARQIASSASNWLGFLFFIFCFLEFSPPVFAISWSDFFPPVQLKDSQRQPPGPAIAPEVVGGLDAYSNTLDNQTNCQKTVIIKKTWEPKKEKVGTDANGNPITQFVSQNARDLRETINVDKISNNGMRNFQSYFAKGEIKCNEESVQEHFKDMNISGSSAFTRMNSVTNLNVERSRFLHDVAESINTQKPIIDVTAQDNQIAWSCNNTCIELSKNPKNCRPVTVSELLYGLRDQEIYYRDSTSPPTRFPNRTLDIVNKYYSIKYKNAFSPLPLETYRFMYDQLSAPKGNVVNYIETTSYDGYDGQRPINPVVTIFKRNLPNAASLTWGDTVKQVNSVNSTPLPQSEVSDYCNNYSANESLTIDRPNPGIFDIFVNGLFKVLAPGEKYEHQEGISFNIRNDKKLTTNPQGVEQAWANLIPASDLDKNNYQDESYTSTVPENEKYNIVDPLNRGNKIYECSFNKFLRPASWQENDPPQQGCPN